MIRMISQRRLDVSANGENAGDEGADAEQASSRVFNALAMIAGLSLLAGLIAFGSYLGNQAQNDRRELPAVVPVPVRLVDSFQRLDPTTLDVPNPTGLTWLSLGAGFDVANGVAQVSSLGDGGPTIAVVDTTVPDLVVGITIDSAATGTGLVLRFQDLFNFWSVVAAPDYATWNLVLTRDGTVVESWPVGFASTASGTKLSVAAQGAEIRVLVDGALFLTVIDSTFQDATLAGIISTTGSGGSLTDFFAEPTQALLTAE